uniref:Pentatricopeptide repeat-containing protein n=1 Tax=Tanacetum cinerariifolium TaxID=118510 RepID=A0A6L2L4P2_TANCI|nr:pentatricopeptide repeat-containing protein [Tanacetum cinerariifolium]
MCELGFQIVQNKQEERRIEEEQAANARYWKIPAYCDDDDDYDFAITPILSTEETIDSLSMGDEHLDTIPTIESDEVIKSSVEDLVPIPSEFEEAAEIVIPEVEEIEDDNLREKLLNVYLLIANIEALKDNPTQSSEFLTNTSSTSLNSFLEETNTFYNSLPEFENFYFDLGEISSGSTTTYSDISLSNYKAFYFDDGHIKEISRAEFVDELAHIISPPKYDRFYFKDLPDPGELMSVLNSGIHENLPSATSVNLPIEDNHSPLLAYVVWIFVAYLTYPVIPPYLHPFGNEDTIFDPSITINHFYSFKPGSSHQHGAFKKFNTHHSHLNEWPMRINGKKTPLLDVLIIPGNLKTLAKGFYPPSLNFLSFNWESDDSDCEACDSECVGEYGGEFGGVSRKRCCGSIIGVDREEIDFGSFAVRMTVVENMASGFHIVCMKAFGFASIEKNGQGIEKNGRGIEKNDRGIGMNGQMTVLRFSLDKCDAFYWIDGELQAAWYKHAMYEMYLSMNGDQRDVFVEEINRHELGILAQETSIIVGLDVIGTPL